MPNINTSDQTEVTEKLTNTKPWFNGPHTFSSVKVGSSHKKPQKLSISVSEVVVIKDRLA